MEMAMVNSYILYKKSMKIQNLPFLRHYDFRLGIIKNLIKPFYSSNKKLNDFFIFDERKNEFLLKSIKPEIDSCRLEYTGEKRLCMSCYCSGNAPKKKFTEFKCKACEIPLCPEGCYDRHRIK